MNDENDTKRIEEDEEAMRAERFLFAVMDAAIDDEPIRTNKEAIAAAEAMGLDIDEAIARFRARLDADRPVHRALAVMRETEAVDGYTAEMQRAVTEEIVRYASELATGTVEDGIGEPAATPTTEKGHG